MFMTDHDKILMQMADPEGVYYKGLNKFRKHILLSNVKNDRTVAFNTSFITEYSPFDNWSNIKIKYLKGLQQSRIGKIYVKPKFVDLNRSIQMTRSEDEVFAGNIQEQTSIFRSNRIFRFLIIFLVSFFLLPFWIPLVLCSSLFASIYSMIKIRIIPAPKLNCIGREYLILYMAHLLWMSKMQKLGCKIEMKENPCLNKIISKETLPN